MKHTNNFINYLQNIFNFEKNKILENFGNKKRKKRRKEKVAAIQAANPDMSRREAKKEFRRERRERRKDRKKLRKLSRRRRKKEKEKRKEATELGISVKDYSQEIKDDKNEIKDALKDDKNALKDEKKALKDSLNEKSKIFQNKPVNSRWRPYPWQDYKNPLDTSSYVDMKGKTFNDLQNLQYLYQEKKKNKLCIDLDKCKKVELKNDHIKKELLHTEIRLEYLKNKNIKKLEKVNELKKAIDKTIINESMLILIIIIVFALIFIVRYYLKVLHKIKI